MRNADIKKLRSFNKYYCVFGRMLNTRLPHIYCFTNITVYVILYLIYIFCSWSGIHTALKVWMKCLYLLFAWIILFFITFLSPKEWPKKPSGVQCNFTQFDCEVGSCQRSSAEIQDHLPAYQWGWPWTVGN